MWDFALQRHLSSNGKHVALSHYLLSFLSYEINIEMMRYDRPNTKKNKMTPGNMASVDELLRKPVITS